MISWIKKLFQLEPVVVEPVEEYVPDISEPVISFVECVKKNPKRFKIHLAERQFEDTKTLQRWNFTYHFDERMYSTKYYPCSSIAILTWDELKYISEELSALYKERHRKYRQLKSQRSQRDSEKARLKERQRLIDVYCEVEDDSTNN